MAVNTHMFVCDYLSFVSFIDLFDSIRQSNSYKDVKSSQVYEQ